MLWTVFDSKDGSFDLGALAVPMYGSHILKLLLLLNFVVNINPHYEYVTCRWQSPIDFSGSKNVLGTTTLEVVLGKGKGIHSGLAIIVVFVVNGVTRTCPCLVLVSNRVIGNN